MALLDKKMWDGYTALALLALLFFLFAQVKGRLFNGDTPVVTSDSLPSIDQPASAWRKPDTLHVNFASPWQLTAAGFSAYDVNTILYARDRGVVFRSPDDLRAIFAYRDMSDIDALIPSIAFDERRHKSRTSYYRDDFTPRSQFSSSTSPRHRRIPLFLADSLELAQAGLSPEAWDTLARFQSAYVLSGSMSVDSLVDCSPAELAMRLAPHIHSVRRPLFSQSEQSPRPDPVELNAATADQLLLIPGIGTKTASAIINLRRDLGGFVSPEQLKGLWPISEESFALMAPFLFADSSAVVPINVNSTNDTRMRRHPYFPPLLVARVNQLKLQNPKARLSVDDIRRCAEGIDLNPFFWSYVAFDQQLPRKN